MDVATVTLYLFLALLIIFYAKVSIKNRQLQFCLKFENYKTSIDIGRCLIFTCLLFFAVFRKVGYGYGGTDALSYIEIFQNTKTDLWDYINALPKLGVLKYSEPLFTILNIVIKSITDDYHILFLITYGIITNCILSFINQIYDEKLNFVPLILLIYPYLHSFNVMRSWMSIGLCVYAFYAMKNKKWKKSMIIILLSSLFHYMALCFLVAWFLLFVNAKLPKFFTRKKLFIIVVFINTVSYICKQLILNIIMTTKYEFYKDYFDLEISIIGYIPTIIVCLVAICFFPYIKKRHETGTLIVLILTANISLIYLTVFMMAWRINDFYMLYRVFMISILLDEVPRHISTITGKLICKYTIYSIVVIVFLQRITELAESSNLFPYGLSI